MNKPLSGSKIALLLANGFCQQDIVESQRVLIENGACVSIISPDQGLVNGWDGKGWGHNFMVDAPLATALGSDYDMLILSGGQRSMDKLILTPHTKRFIKSFMMAEKPAAVFGEALNLLIATDNLSGRSVHGPLNLRDTVLQADAKWSDDEPCFDLNLMTGTVDDDEARSAFIAAMLDYFIASTQLEDAA